MLIDNVLRRITPQICFDPDPEAGGGSGMATVDDAVLSMGGMDFDQMERDSGDREPDDRSRDDVGRFKSAQENAGQQNGDQDAEDAKAANDAESGKETGQEAKGGKDDAAEEDDEDYLEWELPAETEDGEPVSHRVKASDVLAGYHRVGELEAELENVKQTAPPPPDYDQAIADTVGKAHEYIQNLRIVERFLQPQTPDTSLLDENSNNYDPGQFNRQLQLAQQHSTQLAHIQAELQRAESETSEYQETLETAKFAREQRKLLEEWPELKEEAYQRDVTDNASKFYGIDSETLNAVHDSRFYAVLKDALAYRDAQTKQSAAVKVVRAKPKLIKGKARGANPQARAQSDGMARLQQSGDLEDAASALTGFDF